MDQNVFPGAPVASQIHRVGGGTEGSPMDILARGTSPRQGRVREQEGRRWEQQCVFGQMLSPSSEHQGAVEGGFQLLPIRGVQPRGPPSDGPLNK